MGIILVGAVLTLPVLIQKYRNHVEETRLAEAQYDNQKYWSELNLGLDYNEDGNVIEAKRLSA